jgi:hypothetical protein
LPLGGHLQAQYAILTKRQSWSFKQHFVQYDHASALALWDKAYLEQVGVMGMLIRQEVAQARGFLMPFFHRYWEQLEAGVPLERLVEDFLATA